MSDRNATAALEPILEELTAAAARAGGGPYRLDEAEVYGLLGTVGVRVPEHAVLAATAGQGERHAWSEATAALGARAGGVVLKILGRELLHKSDLGGVRILRRADELEPASLLAAADDLLERVRAATSRPIQGVLAAALVPYRADRPGAELLLSLRRDPAFGPVVVLGVGGVLTEWYGKVSGGGSRLILPADGLDRETVVDAVTGHPALALFCHPSRLYRDPPLAPETLADAILALAALARAVEADGSWHLAELEVNPAVAVDGRVVALDGVGQLAPAPATMPARPRDRIADLLAPRSAVLAGVSASSPNPGRVILDNLLAGSDIPADRLWVVHPKEESIAGVPCLRRFRDLPQPVDLAVISVPAAAARDAIAELVDHDLCRSIVLIPGGFSEVGATDLAAAIEGKLAEGHRRPDGGPVLVGGNSLGIVSRGHYNTFFIPRRKLPFHDAPAGDNLALVSQSGAYLVTYASNYDGLILPRASISFGNQMDLTAGDFLAWFAEAPGIDVVACYLEGFRADDGRAFLEAARRCRERGRLVIVYKAGRTAAGAKAAASHTASLAGDFAVARACLESAGVLVTESLSEFEDLITLATLLAGRTVRGRRVGIVSNAGFECTAVTDSLAGLEVVPFDAATRAVLDEVMPEIAHRDNPVDATPMATGEAYARAIAAIGESPVTDAVIVSAVPVTPALDDPGAAPDDPVPMDGFADACGRLLSGMEKPAVAVFDSGAMYDDLARRVARAGVPVFRKIDRAGRALSRYLEARLARGE